jgi:aspartyl-tRNA(Asn)/glutamyl-tRNA(Gln) amidotransferase subunit B
MKKRSLWCGLYGPCWNRIPTFASQLTLPSPLPTTSLRSRTVTTSAPSPSSTSTSVNGSTTDSPPQKITRKAARKAAHAKADQVEDPSQNTKPGWEVVIGLELHAQIASTSKLFSGAGVSFIAPSNCKVSLIDAAYPGTLPSLNGYCVRQAIKAGLALNGRVNRLSRFDRKHYFYADLPAGYQITQNQMPIVSGGSLTLFPFDENRKRTVRIDRIQLEQDSGKLFHDEHPVYTLVDLNRAGVGLLEIVSKPDMRSGQEVVEYLTKMQALLHAIDVSDTTAMDASALRCDINISVNRVGGPPGTRCEIKNVNSIKHIVKAIEYETGRQMEVLAGGGTVTQETRHYDPEQGKTIRLRTKEDEVDYRYFPEPDLPPLILPESLIEEVKAELPELPDAKQARLIDSYKLSAYNAKVLVDMDAVKFFEESIAEISRGCSEEVSSDRKGEKDNAKLAQMICNWITSELSGLLSAEEKTIAQSSVTPSQLSSIIQLIQQETISGAIGKQVIELMHKGDTRNAKDIIEEKGWVLTQDNEMIEELCKQVVANNPEDLAKFRSGKTRVKQFFVGEVMKRTKGKANPKRVTEILEKYLSE